MKVLAISSGGGHWVQLLRLCPAFVEDEVVYVSVAGSDRSTIKDQPYHVIPDASRWNKIGLVRLALRIAWIIFRERPDVVVTTGAAPGYFALRLARLFRSRTIWIDSIANVEQLSLSGRMAGRHADLWLTQWPDLAHPDGPRYMGAVV